MHEVTSVAEFKRLFGSVSDDEIKVDVPGMEVGTQHEYGIDILVDFKPEDSPMRPDTAEAFKKRLANPAPEGLYGRPHASRRIQPAGVPRLLSWALGARHVRGRDARIQRPDRA